MKLTQYRRLIASASMLSLLLAVSPTSLAVAQHGGDSTSTSGSGSGQATETETSGGSGGSNGGSSSSTQSSGGSTSGRQQSGRSTLQTNSTNSSRNSGESEAESGDDGLRARADKLLSDERAGHKQHTEAERQDACKQHQGEIDNRFSTLGTKAQRHLDAFNAVFTKVQAFQTKNQLNVSNYDSLVADATAKQSAAASAVSALTLLSGTKVDCTTADPASTVASVKTAADDARTALQAYRTSLKTLVSALLTAKGSTSTGGNS